jgi:hypothetical protein
MSHLVDLTTTIKDTDALVEALKQMGLTNVEIHETAVTMSGYHGIQDNKKAHVIVRKQHSGIPSDIGFEMGKDGFYHAHIDNYNYCANFGNTGCKGGHYDEAWTKKLQTYYNVNVSEKALISKGIKYEKGFDKAGRITLKAIFKTDTDNRIKNYL